MQIRPRRNDVGTGSGANSRSVSNVPRDDVPGDRKVSGQAGLLVEDEEVLGSLVGVVPGDKAGCDGLWARGLQEEEAPRGVAAVCRVEVRNLISQSPGPADSLNKAGEGGDVFLVDRGAKRSCLMSVSRNDWGSSTLSFTG